MSIEPLVLDSLTLPNYLEFKELTDSNATKNITLDGALYVDLRSWRRSWQVSFKHLTSSEYDSIRAKYEKQFTDATLLNFVCSSEGIDTMVYMEISDRNPKWNGTLVVGYSITLTEQGAFS